MDDRFDQFAEAFMRIVPSQGVEQLHALALAADQAGLAQTPPGRLGQPEGVARVAVFLASDDAGWVTGERITAAGGWN